LLLDQVAGRLPWLVPIRDSRMGSSPCAFFRVAAAVMALNLSRQVHSGLVVQLCGDAHRLNVGRYALPERQAAQIHQRLVFPNQLFRQLI
jgi:hypothetical protein